MATSQCFKCGNRSFESVAKIPIGSPRRVMFVQCTVCGSVVGIQEEHGQSSKINSQQVENNQEPVLPLSKTQFLVPPDINTVLKLLYG